MIIKPGYRKLFSITLKMLVFGATLWYLYEKVLINQAFSGFRPFVKTLGFQSVLIIILVVFLMFINWGIETQKWRMLIGKFEKISFWRAYRAVWSGITINNWIPNRMGEFAGRILYISAENQPKSVIATFISSFAQMTSTIIIGLPALIIHFHKTSQPLWSILSLLIIALFILIYFNNVFFHKTIKYVRIPLWISRHTEILETYKKEDLAIILLMALLRFSVYIFQYYLLFQVFNIILPVRVVLPSLASIFFIQTFIPAITLTEIGIRGAVILYVFNPVQNEVLPLLSAAWSLWLINIIIPSVFGAFFILFKKRNKTAL